MVSSDFSNLRKSANFSNLRKSANFFSITIAPYSISKFFYFVKLCVALSGTLCNFFFLILAPLTVGASFKGKGERV
jgi:hypothetical protein